MNNTAVVTGAGSGVGRAIALALARAGWKIAGFGRRQQALDQTITLAGNAADRLSGFVVDVADAAAVARAGQQVLKEFGHVDVLVNSAGTNAPRRALEVLSSDDYHAMINTNLNGAYYCIQAFLPDMRRRRSGTIVNVISDAGKLANAKAGPAYVASKFGLTGLTQSINCEERVHGIRACAIFPGDIDTPLLDRRPQPPTADARARMLQPDDVAACVLLAVNLPERAVVEEILIRPRG
jgi:NAD(P)-dependent dehydrogenase (short-subunit alcohol dehydrogenase family)